PARPMVRCAREGGFSPNVEGGGEEFLVLDGVFSDEHGDFAAGSYIRNPPQSRHTPGSKPGCTILVKLWQFDQADRSHVRIDTNKMPYVRTAERPEVEVMPLFRDGGEDVRLERWPASTRVELALPGGGEFFDLDGAFEEGGETFVQNSWLRLPPGARLQAASGPKGCRVWVKTAHLAQVRGLPAAKAS